MERGTTDPARDAALPDGTAAVPPPALGGLLDGLPRPRAGAAGPAAAPAPPGLSPARPRRLVPPRARPRCLLPTRARPRCLLPTPAGTPFTVAYAAVLAVTSLVAALADPALVHALQQGSSTDVAHLVRTPLLVLPASALWIAGGVVSPYAALFVLVLTALERRIGGVWAAGVFVAGHVLATLATEVPVGLAVLAGHLPGSSLHRLDYGISFGVATSTGALAGLLRPRLRWPALALTSWVLLTGLVSGTDPLTGWGHVIALVAGVAAWPLVRRRHRAVRTPPPLRHT
ncbi:hypothetical protein GCM10018980_28610 [Streptomyces capoamus]|uniref:Uncharacterized protein n=1 Tax=Streptomyces capoamus TaxID=68183 RepID=A0A919C5S1_9ACTN|nr:rhomboid-like protein [Streptomyces capoamus]GGW19163.1 hypothetical protein GCM10010501_53190 [Streptomyces libani subsp. rufus]GHG48381.1 hypothetical protein GCM10018980_28610 [Streptomyces capoamus]